LSKAIARCRQFRNETEFRSVNKYSKEIIMTRNKWRVAPCIFALALFSANAGVVNPDISAIGQVVGKYSDDSLSPFPKKPTLELGEVELMLDAALNPYLTGAFVLSLDTKSIEIEEAYASVIRGLPLNLGLKAGKYRLGFGRLNPMHPHAYPFISTPRIMDPRIAKLIPGDESFNDVAVEASTLIPVVGSYAISVSGDLLQGDSFHPDTVTANFGGLARIVNSFVVADLVPSEIGLSFTEGTNDPRYDTKSLVAGVDLKTKLALSPTVTAIVQGELIYKNAEHVDSLGAFSTENRTGLYAFTDFRFQAHYNAGVLYEQYQSPNSASQTDRGIKPFVGFAVLEESTLVRLAYEYFMPATGKTSNTVELQFLYSMGPHKAHLF
jgi:hypothetical protein